MRVRLMMQTSAILSIEPQETRILGSAFMVAPGYWATAFHVVKSKQNSIKVALPRFQENSDYQETGDGQITFVDAEIWRVDPIRDLCIVKQPGEIGPPTPTPAFGGADNLTIGDPVSTMGFPHADWGRLVLTRRDTAVGAKVLLPNSGMDVKHLVLNMQGQKGQSGGAVVDLKTGVVVAVLVGNYAAGGGGHISIGGIDPATLNETTYAVSAEYLGEMFK